MVTKIIKKKMLPLLSLDVLFNRSEGAECLNEITPGIVNITDHINEKLFFKMDGQIEYSAKCFCGKLIGNYNEGVRCGNCGTLCSSEFINLSGHKNWISIPEIMPGVLHPDIYFVLKGFLGKKKFTPLIDIILDPSLPLPPELRPVIQEQGYTYFYNNYDRIINFFLTEYPKTVAAQTDNPFYRDFFMMYRDITFCKKLPILDPSLHSITILPSNKVKIDASSTSILSAISTLTYSLYELKRSITSKYYADKALWKSYSSYIDYVESIVKTKISGKHGFLRKQLYGIRTHFSFRAVIVPNTTSKYGNYIKLPWVIGVHTFKLHILNHLIYRHGFTLENASIKYNLALVKYDPLIKEVLDAILKEYPHTGGNDQEGFATLLGRNPSLVHGSLFKMRIVDVKTDIEDNTINFSPLVAKVPNSDYDGKLHCRL